MGKKQNECAVCGLDKGKKKKVCTDCAPFWNKARTIANSKKRKPVTYDTQDKERNIALFANAMKEDWDNKNENNFGLCKYTWLPMILKLPQKVKYEDKEILKFLVFSPDRLDSNKNYEPGNVEVCSYLGNIMKNALNEKAFNSVITGIVETKIAVGRDKQLAKMLHSILEDFYSETRLNQKEVEQLIESVRGKEEV